MARIIQSLNQDWLFKLGDEELGGNVRNLTDYSQVSLPHNVKLTPAISSGGLNYQGICIYHKQLDLREFHGGKQIMVEFDGAMGVTQLYINHQYVMTHYCGYIPLVQDITNDINWGELNTIELRLDNSDHEDVPPGKPQHGLDFTYDGGLYREARLIIVDPLHITHPLLEDEIAGGGIFVAYKNVTPQSADVIIKTHIQNGSSNKRQFILKHVIKKYENYTSEEGMTIELEPLQKGHFECIIRIKCPDLWSPENPNLYQVYTTIEENEQIIDEVVTIIGIRTFKFTYDQNLIFNGVSRKISGANYHHTHVYIGNALTESVLRRDALKLRQAGFKNIRSHYPLTPGFINACNEYGLTLIVSAPGWQWFKEGIFEERAKDNVRKMIRWQRNNPCIIIWEPMLNESYMSNEFKEEVVRIVHEEYPYEDCYAASDSGPGDIIYKEFDENMLEPDRDPYEMGKADFKPIWVREYNDRPDDWNNQSCAWRVPRGWGEEGMLRAVDRALGKDPQCRRQNYIDMVNDKKICGYGIWPGIEHNRGYQVTPCWGGVLDLYRVPKFAYYFFQSQQDREEVGDVLFIANYWSEISSNDVVVYSNAERMRLYHNDKLVGEIGPDDVEVAHPPFTFKNIRKNYKTRERSLIKVEALVGGEVVATHIRKSPGVQRRLKLEADFMNIPLKADGSDLVMIYCKVLDDEGNIVPMTADRYPIYFTIEGEGEIVGDETIGANPICPEAGITAIFVRATTTKGAIKIKAELYWQQRGENAVVGDELVIHSC